MACVHLLGQRVAARTDLRKPVESFLQKLEVGGGRAHSANHGGRPTGRWAPPVPLYFGGLPRVSLLLSHVSKLLVCRLGDACGPFDPCEPEFCALIGQRFFSWIIRSS